MFEGISSTTFAEFLNELFSIVPYCVPVCIGYLGLEKALSFLKSAIRGA